MVESNLNPSTEKKTYHARFLTRILRSSYFTAGVGENKKANITPLIVETRRYQPEYSRERSLCYENVRFYYETVSVILLTKITAA